MQDALSSLTEKGTPVSPGEHTAALAAALLHDIGHGPFSHTLEHTLIRDFNHESMSRALLDDLNARFDGALDLAIRIFDGVYERRFFHQLVSSQLDMDRLDYLRRDSFYTGVVEGEVGVARIIKTLRVEPLEGGPDSRIVIESKGIYAVENFLIARRLMYWQVYLHKTVVAGDHVLRHLFRRVREHLRAGRRHLVDGASPALLFFLEHEVDGSMIWDPEVRRQFCDLDDSDVLYSLKRWQAGDDPVLADLSRRFINRDFFRLTFLSQEPTEELLDAWRQDVSDWLAHDPRFETDPADADYYLALGHSGHSAYERVEDSIRVLDRDGIVHELSETADSAAVKALTRFEVKPYVCFPKEVDLSPLPVRAPEIRT
jgi:HD superfamily phosphohydrolase